MEASVVSQDTGPLTGASSSAPSSSSLPSHPPARPCRPRPPPPAIKSSQLPPRPSLHPSLPPPLPPPSLSSNPPPPSLPPPLSPIVISPTPQQSAVSSDPLPSFSPPSPPSSSPTVSSPPPSVVPPSSPAPPTLSSLDKLVGSVSVWQPDGLDQEQTSRILEEEPTGTFLVHGAEEKPSMISVRRPDEDGAPLVLNMNIKQHKTFLHLEGSSLVFDDIFKLISFYCASRDILTVPLKLPQAITTATKREELEVMSAMGADFWTSHLNQRTKNEDDTFQPSLYLYINPVPVEDPHPPSTSPITENLQNGDVSQLKAPPKTIQETKYKRPPPRPPSLGSGSGSGLLFSPPPSPQTLPPVTPEGEKKEDVRRGVGEKSASTPPPPSRPPVPPQGRAAPPLPPAPLRRNSSKKNTDRDPAEGTEREKGHNPAKKTEREGGAGLLGEDAEQTHKDEEGNKGVEKEVKQRSGSQCPSVKKPGRPIPPPRTKPGVTDPPGGGSTNQSAGMRIPPPSPARRPDVSLYSPQGGGALGADLDSCSTSSTEEEGEPGPEQNHRSIAESRSPKAGIRRTPTTVMLNRARSRLSTVLTGLISHDRRLSKRIVELARDPLSYFGNLVKEHRAFTLETMSNHSTTTELLQEIRQMMTQLKSYFLQSTELQAMMEPQHQYTQDKLESIVEAALCKSVLKPLREPIYQNLEKLYTNAGSTKQLAQNQSVVLGSTTTALGISTSVPEASAMEKISIKLNNLHQEYSPQRKIELLLKTCKIIYDSMSVSSPGRAHGADDFLPVMMYVLARSNLHALQLDVEYMMELMDPSLTLGEGSYYLTTTYGALEHIKTFDQQRSATRQLSREVQDSIHRWERRRTLNQESMAQASVRDFLTVYCPEIGSNPKTLGVLPTTTIQQLTELCAARFEQDSCMLSVYMDGVLQAVAATDLALSVKNSCLPGAYCFVYHPIGRTCPSAPPPAPPPPVPPPAPPPPPPPAPPVESLVAAEVEAVSASEPELEEESLINL